MLWCAQQGGAVTKTIVTKTIRYLLQLLVLLPLMVLAQGKEKTLPELKSDLKKVERAIDVTKAKMKEVRDVSFVPDLYFVLAELHVEKSRYEYAINRAENPKTPLNELDFSDSTKSKKQAIEVYQRFTENFPKHENLDKALFFMAHEYREMGDNENMVKIYQRLTKEFPKSSFWEESMLILGNFFLEQKKDPRMAQDFYQKIIERPENPFIPVARYKLGWCYINQNDFEKSLNSFEGVVTIDTKIDVSNLPPVYKKTDVRRDALVAMVWPYSEQKKLTGERAHALNYFERLVPDRVSLLKVLSRLAKRLMMKEKVEDAIPVYFRLMEITHSTDDLVGVIDGWYEALRKSKKTWPIELAAQPIADTLLKYRNNPDVPKAEVQKVEKNFEIYLRDIVTRLQKKAKSTGQAKDYDTALASYTLYLGAFPNGRYTSAMLLNMAESHFSLNQYARAGNYYESVSRRPFKGSKKSFQDSAIQAFAMALKTPEKLSKIELEESRAGFRDLGALFMRSYPQDPANPMIQFNIARTYYDERDFDKAVAQFKVFIQKYPGHKEATAAGQLILDSYNQREDYANLIAAGKELIANPRMQDVSFKKDVSEIVRQAEFRKVQDSAGDPKSREYAKKLLSFASKYQGTALGDAALYEAFVSFKKKKDPQAYEPGEQLLIKHGDSKYAKEVVGAMGQMALNTADYRRAAKYFEMFARKYPNDQSSPQLLKNASSMRLFMGDFKEASESQKELKSSAEEVAKPLVMAQDWAGVAQIMSARPSGTLRGQYYMGLSLYRQGQREQARSYLASASKSGASSFEEKTMAAHALYLLASLDLKKYQSIQLGGGGDEGALVKQKSAMLAQLSGQMNQVIGFGNGRWTIAALYELGRANEEFSQFVSNASIPAGLNPAQQAQYKQIVAGQANQYRNKAIGFFSACVDNAQKSEVFTNFVKGCASKGAQQINEELEEKIQAKAQDSTPGDANRIRTQLFDNPRDTKLLMQLAQSYLKGQDYSMARLIFNRMNEIEPSSAEYTAWTGVTLMFMNDLEGAAAAFREALKKKGSDPVGLYGIAALYKQFGFTNRYKAIESRLKSAGKPKGYLHPWMSGL